MARRSSALAMVLALTACGQSSGAVLRQTTPHASVATSPSPSPAPWPTGGPVPQALTGLWYFDTIPSQITLSGNDYNVDQPANKAHGNVVVNGDEIDFFNGDACERMLPDGVGRYRWQLQGESSVHFTPLNSDPCGRYEILVNKTWTRTSTLH